MNTVMSRRRGACCRCSKRLAQRGAITPEMLSAGREFHADFRLAQLDGLRAAALYRIGGRVRDAAPPGNEKAHKAVMQAVNALGGGRSVAASCLWHVLGLEWSLRRWAIELGGCPPATASGILIASLGVLAPRLSRLTGR